MLRQHLPNPLGRVMWIVLLVPLSLVITSSGSGAQESNQQRQSPIVFETDFSQNTGYEVGNTSLWNGGAGSPFPPPAGWDGVIVSGENGRIAVDSGEGVDGTNALRMEWDPERSQPTVSLAKHLTGDETTGYDDLFIRYRVRLPNGFMAGDEGDGLQYWKWGRLWQNTSVDNSRPNNWTENRENSGFVVWNFGNNFPYTRAKATFAANEGENLDRGSAGGERYRADFWFSGNDPEASPGQFEAVWDLNRTDRPGTLENNTDQQWHTIEYRFRLATTPTSNDGLWEMWFDGESQGVVTTIDAGGGAPEVPGPGIPLANQGSGFNFFVLFDNMAGWNSNWSDPDVDGWVWVNDVVVSTERIGHDYSVGATAASRLGDVNCDLAANMADTIVILEYRVGKRTPGSCADGHDATEIDTAHADVNGDGSVNLMDALIIAQCNVRLANEWCDDLAPSE